MSRVIGIRVLRRNADGSIECVTDPTGCCDRSGSGTLSCVTDCTECPTGISSLLYIELLDAGDCSSVTAGEKILSYQPLDNMDCRWATDYGDQWELYYDAPDATWYLVGGGGELIYQIGVGGWDCDGSNSFTLVSAACTGADAALTVTQNYPCPVSYNCVSGDCVQVAGEGGTYATLGACEAVCGSTDTVSVSCCGCVTMPRQWQLVVSGITDGTCSLCDPLYNGTHTLTYTSGCLWETPLTNVCGSGPQGKPWIMFVSGGTVGLVPGSEGVAMGVSYAMSCDAINCLGPNTFTRIGVATGVCGDWPATLTITPL